MDSKNHISTDIAFNGVKMGWKKFNHAGTNRLSKNISEESNKSGEYKALEALSNILSGSVSSPIPLFFSRAKCHPAFLNFRNGDRSSNPGGSAQGANIGTEDLIDILFLNVKKCLLSQI